MAPAALVCHGCANHELLSACREWDITGLVVGGSLSLMMAARAPLLSWRLVALTILPVGLGDLDGDVGGFDGGDCEHAWLQAKFVGGFAAEQ
jgi:hypothetical protein